MPPRSLQNRLLLSFLVSMTAILALGGFVIYTVIGRHLASENDDLLRDRLTFYETTLKLIPQRGAVNVTSHLTDPEWSRISNTGNPDLVQGWFAETGRDLSVRSPALGDDHELPRLAVKGGEVAFSDHKLWDGRPARLASRVFVPMRDAKVPADPPYPLQIVVGRDLLSLQKTMSKVHWFLIKIGLAVMGVLLIASRFIVRRGVKPVNSLANQIEVMPLADEGARFGLPGAPSELQPVVGRLNALMDRVGAAIEHERQFASNAAHELRNPLAAIRSTIEVALSRTRKPEEYEDTLENILHSQQGMQRVVDHLLLLARLESGHRQSEYLAEPAVLGKMLKKAWRSCIDLAHENKLRVTWHVENPDAEITTVVSLAGIVFSNLLENAVNYTPAGGEVRIDAALQAGRCRVAVTNTNPGLRPEMLEQTFAPFWRADPNASGHRGNAGIGLALCRRIAATLGGSINASLTPEGMVSYQIEFPVAVSDGGEAKKPPASEPAAANA